MAEILDSGNRTEFDSGAVRDMQDDKGRCDLLPLDIVGHIMYGNYKMRMPLLDMLERYKVQRDVVILYEVVDTFIDEAYNGVKLEALLDLAVHFRDGAVKYGIDNWKKGLPEWSYLSSAVRHYLKWRAGLTDERHDRAFLWNIVCLIWTVENKSEIKASVRQKTVLEK